MAGGELHFDEPVMGWSALPAGDVLVRTSRQTYAAEHLVITAGPWAPQIPKQLNLPLRVTRQVVYRFEPIGSIDLFVRTGCLSIFGRWRRGSLCYMDFLSPGRTPKA